MSEKENNPRFSAAFLAEEAEAKKDPGWAKAHYQMNLLGPREPKRFNSYKELSPQEVSRIAQTWVLNDNDRHLYTEITDWPSLRRRLDAELRQRSDPQAVEKAGMFEEETPMKKDKDKRTLSSQRNEYIDKTYDEDLNKKED